MSILKSIFYNNNPSLPKAMIDREYSEHEINEFKKCRDDILYFADNYFYAIDNEADIMKNIELFDYQREAAVGLEKNTRLIMLTARQIGKTTVATVLILHTALFQRDKITAVVAGTGMSTSIEILDRIKDAYENLPDFLKQGVKIWNKKTIKFENGCSIIAIPPTKTGFRGKSIYFLYVDELAYIENWEDFASNALATVSSKKENRIVYTSTPNGMNHFYDYCTLAKQGKNDFYYIEVPWWKVKGRDEAWKQKTLKDLNYDIEKFEAEHECKFLGSSNTLISGSGLEMLEAKESIHSHEGIEIYEHPIKDNFYTMVCDVGEGKGLDYSTFSIINITKLPYTQVATYRSNTINPYDFADIIETFGKTYNEAYILIELNNSSGAIIAENLYWQKEYMNLFTTIKDKRDRKITSVFQHGNNIERGVYTNVKVKQVGCSLLKLLIESQQLIINDKETINELKTFSKKNKSYEAESGKHDDLVMTLVLFSWLTNQDYFKELNEEVNLSERLKEFDHGDLSNYVGVSGIMFVSNGIDVIASDDDLNMKDFLCSCSRRSG